MKALLLGSVFLTASIAQADLNQASQVTSLATYEKK